jgi:septum formation protein
MIYLASLSPRRCELLEQINVKYQQVAVNVDETPQAQEEPQDYVIRLALAKARAGQMFTTYPVLGADTAIVCDEQLFGKPSDKDDAKQMLRQLSGRSHQVMTAVALVTTIERVRLSISKVYFRHLTESEIEAYIATGEPFDKAGSYAIQGQGSIFIKRIKGSYSGIMGLPLYETAMLLAEIGILSAVINEVKNRF